MHSGENQSQLPQIKLHTTVQEELARPEIVQYRGESREAVQWTRPEVEALMEGVETHGRSWNKILNENKEVFNSERRPIDLVHKYLQVSKQDSYYKTPARTWVEVDSNGEVMLDLMGEVRSVRERFPFCAAKRFAQSHKFSGEVVFIVNVAEQDNLKNLHCYKVDATTEHTRVRKQAHSL